MLPPVMVYSWSFTAATPSFKCRTSIEYDTAHNYMPSISQCHSQKQKLSLHECQRCFLVEHLNESIHDEKTPLIPCRDFSFDQTHFQSTLVEEVMH